MNARDTLKDSLEDLIARILAADPSNIAHTTRLRSSLEAVVQSMDTDSPSAKLLLLGLKALQTIERQKCPNAPDILNATAVAAHVVVQDLSGGSDGSEIATAADSLASLLAFREINCPQFAAEQPGRDAVSDLRDVDVQISQALDSDPELLRDFVDECCDRVVAAEAALLALEATPDDEEQINTILRAFHTVKGASGFLGLDRIQELAHLAENLLISARDGKIRMVDEYADTALQACDALRIMVKGIEPGKVTERLDPGKLAGLIERLSNIEVGQPQAVTNAIGDLTVTGPPEDEGAHPPDTAIEEDAQASPKGPMEAPLRPTEGVRVSADRLDELVNMVGELVIAHSVIAQGTLVAGRASHQLTRSVSHAGKILRSLQDLTLGLRMVPLRPTFMKMARLVRDLARKSGKSVQFLISGEDTEIDRNMVEVLSDPLVHMVRNAVDHGIETPADRTRGGKNPAGTISLSAYHCGGNVVIELRDDGKGLNRQKILAKAIDRGLASQEHELTDSEVYPLIFMPGLSTAEQVTDVSGRGVGMDVVKRNIDSLRGKIEVRSEDGQGSAFTLRLPLTLAITNAMLLTVGAERFLLPTASIEHSFRPAAGAVSTVTGRGEMVMVRGQLLPVFRLHRLLGVDGAVTDPTDALLIVIEGGGRRCAVMVDELFGQQQVVIKPLGKMFANIPGISGGAILGDGRVGLILDAAGLMQLSRGQTKAA